MNNKIKTIGAALLAVTICASFAGCANSETSGTGKIENSSKQNSKSNSSSQSSTESKPESDNISDNSASKPEETDVLPEITVAATDEILNASLNSGLVQFYNDVFQCGGYITVSEFIEKYKSSYSFTLLEYGSDFSGKPVTDEILNMNVEPNIKDSVGLSDLSLWLVPKFTVKDKELNPATQRQAYAVNPTDKAIPFSECYISIVELNDCPFYPKALNEEITDIPEFLKSLGYEETLSRDIKPSIEFDKKFHKDSNDNYWFYEVGETNAFGAKPFYKYWIFRDGEVKGLNDIGYIFE